MAIKLVGRKYVNSKPVDEYQGLSSDLVNGKPPMPTPVSKECNSGSTFDVVDDTGAGFIAHDGTWYPV